MQAVAILIGLLAFFVIGYSVMNKLDAFLASDWKEEQSDPACGKNDLRIGFSDPFAAESISGVLEAYGKQQPSAAVHLFSGEEHELRRDLEAHKLDLIFLPESADLPEKAGYHAQKVILSFAPVMMNYAGLSIEPIKQDHIVQKAVWRDCGNAPVMDSFLALLNGSTVNLPQE